MDTKRVKRHFAGAGFVFTHIHNTQPDVPPETVLAMVDVLKTYRDYA